METHDEELLKPDDISDTIEQTLDEEEQAAENKQFRKPVIVLVIVLAVGALLAAGIVAYHAKVSDSFSEAIQGLFAARSGTGSGKGSGKSGAGLLGEELSGRREYDDFVFHIAGNGREDRILLLNVVLDFAEDHLSDDIDHSRMRTIIYSVSKELVSEKNILEMPLRLVRREMGKRILEETKKDFVTGVYFTRFVML